MKYHKTTRGALLSSVSVLALAAGCTGPFDPTESCSSGLTLSMDTDLKSKVTLNVDCEVDSAAQPSATPEIEQEEVIGIETDAKHFQANNVVYLFGPKTVRNLPVDPDLMARISTVANNNMPPNTVINVTSGGQPPKGQVGKRTGSTRHDHGNAVDFHFEIDGIVVLPDQRPDLYQKFIFEIAKTYAGIGHYAWGIHVGGGPPAFWGPDKTSKTANPLFLDAYNKGRAAANN